MDRSRPNRPCTPVASRDLPRGETSSYLVVIALPIGQGLDRELCGRRRTLLAAIPKECQLA